jgi:flagellar basal-body rod modification protein FlgD
MSIDTTKVDLSASASSTQGAKSEGSSTLGKNEFLELLCTQMANQDPTKPMDSTAFVAELAQFSALEEQENTNTTLTDMLSLQKSSAGTTAVAMVGKDAVYDSNQMDLAENGTITVGATLAADAGAVSIMVQDADGNVIRQQDFGSKNAGSVSVTWDGKNQNGAQQAAGTYSITVSAVDVNGKTVGVTQQSRGRITGVSFEDGSTQLLIGNTSIPISDVKTITESSNSH